MDNDAVDIETDGGKGSRGRVAVERSVSDRRIWSEAEKGRIVRESFGRGAVVDEVARRHGIAPQQLTRWRRQAREGRLALVEDAASAFVPLAIEDAVPASAVSGTIEIVVGRVVVRAGATTSAERLAEIAAALEARL
jgi:transposase